MKHAIPRDDGYNHDLVDCLCGAFVDIVERPDGAIIPVMIHRAADGRALPEDSEIKDCAVLDCRACAELE